MKTQKEDSHIQVKKRGLQKKPIPLIPYSWTSSLQKFEEIDLYYLNHPVYGTYGIPSK